MTAARPRRGWLWWTLAGVGALSLVAGIALRTGLRTANPEALMLAALAGLGALWLVGETIAVLQDVQAREVARAALAALGPEIRVSGRVRVSGPGRPQVVDHVVVGPGVAWAVLVDGSTASPRAADPDLGLGRLLDRALAGAKAVQAAAGAGVLPPTLGLDGQREVRAAILVARRPAQTARRRGVLIFPADAARQALLPAGGQPGSAK